MNKAYLFHGDVLLFCCLFFIKNYICYTKNKHFDPLKQLTDYHLWKCFAVYVFCAVLCESEINAFIRQ